MKYLYNHTSEETAYIVEDYPWGFRLRTKVRYWIESKKGFGQRFCIQTMNPKTGLWCAAKKATYSYLGIMFLDENNHVKWESVSLYAGKEPFIKFRELHLNNLDEYQKDILIKLESLAK